MDRIDHYQVRGELARGAMGVVYRAHDPNLGRDVAVKLILDAELAGPDELARFQTEAQVMARLRHPNVVPILGTGVTQGRPYLVMELVEGESLAGRLKLQGRLPQREAVRVASRVALALGHAHQQGVVHRDVKPENVLFDRHDEPRLTDFGIAKVFGVERGLTATGEVLGTPYYMAPEAAHGQKEHVGPPTDVYGLGAVLFQMLTGEVPFRGRSLLEILDNVVVQPVPRVRERDPELDLELDEICAEAMAKDPADRFSDGDAFAARLAAWSPPIRSGPSLLLPAGVGLLGLLVGLAVGLLVAREEPPPVALAPPVTPPQPTPTAAQESLSARGAARVLIRQARLLAEENRCDAALRLLEEAERIAPQVADLYAIRGFTLFLRDGSKAGHILNDELSKAQALDPAGTAALVREARRAGTKTRTSLALLAKAIALEPDSAWLHFAQAVYYRTLKEARDRDRGFRAAIDRAIQVNPRFVAAYLARAKHLVAHGEAHSALEDASRGLKLDPRNYELYVVRALVRRRIKEASLEEALLDYRLAERFAATPRDRARAILGRAPIFGIDLAPQKQGIEQGQLFERALHETRQAEKADPTHSEVFYMRALILEKMGRAGEALAEVEKAIGRLEKRNGLRERRYVRIRKRLRVLLNR